MLKVVQRKDVAMHKGSDTISSGKSCSGSQDCTRGFMSSLAYMVRLNVGCHIHSRVCALQSVPSMPVLTSNVILKHLFEDVEFIFTILH